MMLFHGVMYDPDGAAAVRVKKRHYMVNIAITRADRAVDACTLVRNDDQTYTIAGGGPPPYVPKNRKNIFTHKIPLTNLGIDGTMGLTRVGDI